MSALKVYAFKNCDSCRKAFKWLDAKGIAYESIPIRDQPPSVAELKRALDHSIPVKNLFNRSGMDYREMNLKDKLPTLSEDKALHLLASNGNLVKRPFVIADNFCLVGFNESLWEKSFHA